jgi:hypothetical protein
MNKPASAAAKPLSEQELQQQRKARFIMLAIVAVFVLPFLVLPLLSSPARMGKTNKGLLIQPHIPLADMGLTHDLQPVTESYLEKRWTLLYVIPEHCDAVCISARNNALYAMRQVRLSLDRDMDRVQQLLVFTHEGDPDLAVLIQREFSTMKQVYGHHQTVENILYSRLPQRYPAGSIFLMSPDGYVFMAYPTFADEKESILRARDMRADLKKTIKGDRNF